MRAWALQVGTRSPRSGSWFLQAPPPSASQPDSSWLSPPDPPAVPVGREQSRDPTKGPTMLRRLFLHPGLSSHLRNPGSGLTPPRGAVLVWEGHAGSLWPLLLPSWSPSCRSGSASPHVLGFSQCCLVLEELWDVLVRRRKARNDLCHHLGDVTPALIFKS